MPKKSARKKGSSRTSRAPSRRPSSGAASRTRRAARSARKAARTRARSARPPVRTPARSSAPRRAAARPAARSGRPATQSAATSRIGVSLHHVDYTTHAMEEVRRFYVELLGFQSYRQDPGQETLTILTGPGSSLGFMPPMPGPPEQWRPPREPALYFMVPDVDRAWRELTDRGARFQQEPTDMPWGHRLAILRDPEGRTVCLAHAIARGTQPEEPTA